MHVHNTCGNLASYCYSSVSISHTALSYYHIGCWNIVFLCHIDFAWFNSNTIISNWNICTKYEYVLTAFWIKTICVVWVCWCFNLYIYKFKVVTKIWVNSPARWILYCYALHSNIFTMIYKEKVRSPRYITHFAVLPPVIVCCTTINSTLTCYNNIFNIKTTYYCRERVYRITFPWSQIVFWLLIIWLNKTW